MVGYIGLLSANATVALINDSIHESVWNDLVLKFKPAFIYKPSNQFNCLKFWQKKINFGDYIFYETNISYVNSKYDKLVGFTRKII